MSSESKGTSKWWEDKQFLRIGDRLFNADWGAQALAIDALHRGLVMYEASKSGTLKGEPQELIQRIVDLDGRLVLATPVWGDIKCADYVFVWDEAICSVWFNDGSCCVRVSTTDKDLFDDCEKMCDEVLGPKSSAGKAYVLVSTSEGLRLKSLGLASVPFERGNYNPKVLEDFDHVVADLKTNDPCGRLIILDGEAGSGKTFCIRGILHEVPEALFVVIPAHLIPTIGDPGMVNALIEVRKDKGDLPTIFIIEDADDCLMPRSSDNVHSVSSLLNLGDGILGATLDIRLICTTNVKGEDLDQAVMRPGRLCRKIDVDRLDIGVAEKVYLRLTGKETKFNRPPTLAEVYRLARDGGWVPPKRKSLGFAPVSDFDNIMESIMDLGTE